MSSLLHRDDTIGFSDRTPEPDPTRVEKMQLSPSEKVDQLIILVRQNCTSESAKYNLALKVLEATPGLTDMTISAFSSHPDLEPVAQRLQKILVDAA